MGHLDQMSGNTEHAEQKENLLKETKAKLEGLRKEIARKEYEIAQEQERMKAMEKIIEDTQRELDGLKNDINNIEEPGIPTLYDIPTRQFIAPSNKGQESNNEIQPIMPDGSRADFKRKVIRKTEEPKTDRRTPNLYKPENDKSRGRNLYDPTKDNSK